MEVKYDDILLRDMKESDIQDYVRWFTTETEWGDWDAPWELFEGDEESERVSWTEYFKSVKKLSENVTRWKFEIERNGVHIGWVSFYIDLEWMKNEAKIPAIGIDIPEEKYRKNGVGTKALKGFMEYLKEQGHKTIYTQTWSGNMPMLRVVEKLGFKEIARKKDYREVRGKRYDALTFQIEL